MFSINLSENHQKKQMITNKPAFCSTQKEKPINSQHQGSFLVRLTHYTFFPYASQNIWSFWFRYWRKTSIILLYNGWYNQFGAISDIRERITHVPETWEQDHLCSISVWLTIQFVQCSSIYDYWPHAIQQTYIMPWRARLHIVFKGHQSSNLEPYLLYTRWPIQNWLYGVKRSEFLY